MQNVSSPWPRATPPFPLVPAAADDTVRMPPLVVATARMPAVHAAHVASEPAHGPEWVADVRRKYTLRITDWVVQAWALTHSPRRFMEEWAAGKREALNPLRFLAVGTALSLVVERGTRYLIHVEATGNPWMAWLHSSLGSTLMICVLSLTMHGVLRLRSRAPVRCTMAAVIYSCAGPGTWVTLLGWLVSIGIYLVRHQVPSVESAGTPYPLPVMIGASVSFGWTVAALAGVHRVRWWWAALSVLAYPVIFALLGILVAVAIALVRHAV